MGQEQGPQGLGSGAGVGSARDSRPRDSRPRDSRPRDSLPQKGKMPAWGIVLIVLAGLGLLIGVPLIVTVVTIVPKMQAKQQRFACANNLSQLGGMWIAGRMAESRAPDVAGPADFVRWRSAPVRGQLRVREGQEGIFICPGDPLATLLDDPAARAAYDHVDLGRVPRGLCSYAVRDFTAFPLDRGAPTLQVIAACIHHRDGVNVAFEDGTVIFMDRTAFEVGEDDELTVGPDSKSPLLRELMYGDGSVR